MSWRAPVRMCGDQMLLTDSTPTERVMDFSQPFSVLNEKLKPPPTTSEQIYSSLNRLEDRQMASLRNKCSPYRPSLLISDTEVKDNDRDDLTSEGSDDTNSADLSPATCLQALKDFDDDSSSTKSDEKDCPDEISSENGSGAPEDESPFQRAYMENRLPDLIRSGRPLGRRRTVGHVSQTLKEVRREVELSRRRSIKLKAQVDKLQEKRDGSGWSQDRERVTEEVLSVLRLLYPLTEPHFNQPEPSEESNRLDSALDQLQKVARNLAVAHTAKQEFTPGNKGVEESAVLQQALRDRDDAIEKKKGMEAELLRSKTELMVLNNQVLEAAQKRLEMSLELEAWKEDFQLLLHQQVLAQQQAEQAQKKTSRLGLLRRSNRPPIQRPSNFPLPSANTLPGNRSPRSPASPVHTAPGSPSFVSGKANWRDKLKRGKTSRNVEQDAESDCGRQDDGFQVISLD